MSSSTSRSYFQAASCDGAVPRRVKPAMTVLSKPSSAFATAICAVVFFLSSADQVFTFNVLSMNVRFANFVLLAGLVAWFATRAHQARNEARWLALGWLPFIAVYALAAVISPHWLPTIVKLGWFAFSFFAAYAWTTLFDRRDVMRAYFLSYAGIAAIIVIDFVNGFSRGPDHMIGFGQANDMLNGVLVFRPHAFYYEPSFAASSLALAWALALTPMRAAAPNVATVLAVAGGVALLVMTSRTGWLFATVAALALLVFHARSARLSGGRERWRVAIPAATGAALLIAVVALSGHHDAFQAFLGRLGVVQAFERVCPRLAEQYAVDLRCLSGMERRNFVGAGQPIDPDETTEGLRLGAMRTALATVANHPSLGVGAASASNRLIAPPAVPNLWLEIALDGGLAALVAFGFGIAYTLYRWRAFEPQHRGTLIVLVLWLCITWQFIATFPRLDLWIAFWAALAWMRGETNCSRACRAQMVEVETSVKRVAPLNMGTR